MYETEVLKQAYYAQAAMYGRDVSKPALPPLDFGTVEGVHVYRFCHSKCADVCALFWRGVYVSESETERVEEREQR